MGKLEVGTGTLVADSLELVPVVAGSHKAGHMLVAVRHMLVAARHMPVVGWVGLCETSVALAAQPSHQEGQISHPSCPALLCVVSAVKADSCQLALIGYSIAGPIFFFPIKVAGLIFLTLSRVGIDQGHGQINQLHLIGKKKSPYLHACADPAKKFQTDF